MPSTAPPAQTPPPAWPTTALPARPVDDLLADQAALVQRIRLCFGLAREAFDADVLPLIRRYAAQVHLLPATADNHFSQPGGLLRLGLETGFFSLQGTDAHIFSGRATISERRQLEPRWRLATFIGGLCSELHRSVNLVTVTAGPSATAGGLARAASPGGATGSHSDPTASHAEALTATWPALLAPLADWLQATGHTSYRMHWHRDQTECRGLGLFVLPQVVPAATLQHLAAGNQVVVPHLLASIGGVPLLREHNVLDALVRRSLALVIDRDLRGQAVQAGRPMTGEHWARYLVQAMQRLVATSASWLPNGDKSRVWWGPDGLYLLWPQAATDIQALLASDQLAGMPETADAMLDVLATAGVLAEQADGSRFWSISRAGARVILQAIRLNAPDVLLSCATAKVVPLDTPLSKVMPATTSPPPPALPPEAPQPPPPTPPPASPPPSPVQALASPCRTSERTSEEPSAPTQADLFATGDGPACDGPTKPTPTPTQPHAPPPGPPAPRLRLRAPMRLNAPIREALSAIVATLEVPDQQAEALVIAEGLFVPIAALQAHDLQPAMAARALADAGMLTSTGRGASPLHTQAFGGAPTQGLVIDRRWIDGLDSSAPPLLTPQA